MSVELKKHVEDLAATFSEFREVNEKRISEIDKLGEATAETKSRFDKFQNRMDEIEAEYRLAFAAMQKGGMEKKSESDIQAKREEELFTKSMFGRGLNMSERNEFEQMQLKSMRSDIASDGGVLSPLNYERSVIDLITEYSPIMELARQYTISEGDQLLVPVKSAKAVVGGWVNEVTAPTETTNTKLANTVTITAHEVFAEPYVTRQMLEDSMINIEAMVQADAASTINEFVNSAFVNGDAAGKPQGFLTGLSSDFIFRSAATTAYTAAEIIRAAGKLKTGYARRATWGISRGSIHYIRTLLATNSGDNYLWQPGLAQGSPGTLLGRPYVEMPDLATPSDAGAYAADNVFAVLADWQNFYGVVRRLGLTVTRDELTAKPYVKYYHRMRIGGARLQSEAGIVLKTKES